MKKSQRAREPSKLPSAGENLSAILRDTSKDPRERIREYTRKMNRALFDQRLLEEIPRHEARAKKALKNKDPSIREIAEKILRCLEELQRRVRNGYPYEPVIMEFNRLRNEGNQIFAKLQRSRERSKSGKKKKGYRGPLRIGFEQICRSLGTTRFDIIWSVIDADIYGDDSFGESLDEIRARSEEPLDIKFNQIKGDRIYYAVISTRKQGNFRAKTLRNILSDISKVPEKFKKTAK